MAHHPSTPSVRSGFNAAAQTTSTNNPVLSPDPPRYRQTFPLPGTPGERNYQSYSDDYADVKDTQVVSPNYEQQNGYHPNGANYRGSRNPSRDSDDTPLSSFLHNVFLSAKLQGGSILTPSSSELSLPYLSSFLPATKPTISKEQPPAAEKAGLAVPSANTVGFVFLCGLWYLSSALSSNTGKSILTRFRYPVTLTFIQFAFVAGYCVVILAIRERLGNSNGPVAGLGRRGSVNTAAGWGIKKPSKTMFQGTFVMSLFQIAGHVFSSMAIARVPVSTVHTIKALSPLFTVLSYAALFRVRYSTSTYTALIPLTLGVMLACSFDLRANAVGFLCALGSTIIFVSQNIFSKKLLPRESPSGTTIVNTSSSSGGPKLDKLNLLFYSSGMAFVLMIPIWAYSDGSALLSAWLQQTPPPSHSTSSAMTSSLTFYFFLNGSVHFAQNLLAFSLLARTSPVTYSIASLIKRIAVICLAIIWSGQKVTLIQGFGMTMTFLGLWMYNSAKSSVEQGERKRTQAEKRDEMLLPTSAEDARLLDGASTPTTQPTPQYSNPTVPYYPPPPTQHHPHPLAGSPLVFSTGAESDSEGIQRVNRTPSIVQSQAPLRG
ncbi:solute carrier family 35, member E1, partial [Phenoliferia sp. Uapishka_3]